MSTFSNVHDFHSFNSKSSKANSGQRLAKVIYKSGKNVKEKKQSICVSVPVVAISDAQCIALKAQVLELVESAQDGIIRDASEAGKTNVSDAEISFECCKVWLETASESARITKEQMSEWFDENVQNPLILAFANKLGISDTPSAKEQEKLDAILASYKSKFSAMAGGRTQFIPEVAKSLEKAVNLVSEPDEIAIRLITRLAKMQIVEINDLDAL